MATLQRYCLVTVGATVGFKALTEQVLLPAFWRFLTSEGFTSLRIQCGPDISWATTLLDNHNADIPEGLTVNVFETTKNLMKDEMLLCTGTILDAWKVGLPVIVVPNEELLDNHQAEMATHLANEGYATMSTARYTDLQGAIHKADLLWEENQSRWPPHSVGSQKNASSLRLWEIYPQEVEKEEDARMVND
ncbi:hypothetical protein MKX08_000479 [Trichoderma sp. CBMAI-0020]|nr:hypothetical protein MKX08_000479 [Trichoderma sp. CBMAI-0020]